RLREKKRRPSRLVILLTLLVFFGLPLGVAAWWFWPRPGPPVVLVVAFDGVGVPKAAVAVVARLEADAEAPDEVSLQGWPVVFVPDPRKPTPHSFEPVKTWTNAEGTASGELVLPRGLGVVPFVAQYAPGMKKGLIEDHAQLYCWPADASLLIVDADRSLAGANLNAWKA